MINITQNHRLGNLAEVQEILTKGMEHLERVKSALPEKPDRQFWEDRIIKYYEV